MGFVKLLPLYRHSHCKVRSVSIWLPVDYVTALRWGHYERDGVSIVCHTVCSDADQRKHQSSASLAFVRGIHRWPVDSPHKGPVTRKMFPYDDVIMVCVTKRAIHTLRQEQTGHRYVDEIFKCVILKTTVAFWIEFSLNMHLWSNCRYVSTYLEYGLVPNRRKTITWLYHDIVHWQHISPLSQNELTLVVFTFLLPCSLTTSGQQMLYAWNLLKLLTL